MGHLADHFARVTAKQQAEKASDHEALAIDASRTEYERMLVKLDDDKATLSNIQSVEKKAVRKREMLPSYQAYVDGVLEAGTSPQDNVLATLLTWYTDVGDLQSAARVGAFVIANGMAMPEGYKRNAATVLAEECADYVLANKSDDAQVDETLTVLLNVFESVADSDMPDQVRAKLHKAMGRLQRELGDFVAAKENLDRALSLDKAVGVKKEIEELERLIKKAAPAA